MCDYQRECRKKELDEGSQNVQTFNYRQTSPRNVMYNMANITGNAICYI